ncbi:TPA: hypothetical protein ACQ7SR_001027 [Klebsiella pneumoniae]
MSRVVTKDDCLAEIKRFLKYYFHFCKSPDPDSVREVLASAYSINDKFRKAGYQDFFDDNNFLAIKAIRNYAIHQSEIYNEAKSLPLISKEPIQADLSILCLLPLEVISRITASVSVASQSAIKKTCVFYKKYVDIYPCIFNFGVTLFLYTEENGLGVDSLEYENFKNSINYERINNLPHHINGGFTLPSGRDIDEFIDNNLTLLKERDRLLDEYYEEENGMYTFKGKV